MQGIAALQLHIGQVVGGDYRIERPLNEGGMGAVYVVEQLSTRRKRALKVMHPQLVPDEKSRLRFQAEAVVGAKISSEHVVEVIAAGVDGPTGVPWLAMELLDGSDLEQLVKQHGALAPPLVARIFRQMGHALAAGHRQGIVHRDLKPENLFLARTQRSDASNTLKILDFGIAKTVDAAKTAATVTTAIGSPLWMAPEQGTPGASLRPSTDVWAMGLLAFHFLTGRYYWASANLEPIPLQALLVDVMVSPIVPASQRARELGVAAPLPGGFDAWFARCVQREPGARYAEAGAAADDLERILQVGASSRDGSTVVIGEGAARAASLPEVPATMFVTEVRPKSGVGAGMLMAVAGAAAALAVVGIVVAGYLVATRDDDSTVQAAAPASNVLASPAVPSPAAPMLAEPPVPPAEPPAEPAATWAGEREPTPGADRPTTGARRRRERSERVRTTDRPPAEATVERPTPTPPASAARARSSSSGGGDIDSLLDSALSGRGGDARGDPNAPRETPSRSDVVAAMNSVSGAVSACEQGQHGLAAVRIVFRGSNGRVSSAVVSRGDFPGPVRSCIARAVRPARVPTFRQASWSINYPFRL